MTITVEGRRRASNPEGFEAKRFSGRSVGEADTKAEAWGATNILYANGQRAIMLHGEWFTV